MNSDVGGGGSGMPPAGLIGVADGGSEAAAERAGEAARVGIASDGGSDGSGGGGSGMPPAGLIGMADGGSEAARDPCAVMCSKRPVCSVV